MAFSVEQFKSKLKLGGARPTLFQVVLNTPSQIGFGEVASLAPFMVQASTLPGSNIGAVPVPYFGRKVYVAGDRTFDPWQVTILNDENFTIRHALESWHHRINSVEGNINSLESSSPALYKADAHIHQYGKAQARGATNPNPIRTYSFKGLFPTQISDISVNWNDTDSIETFNVTFAYDWFEISNGPGVITG